ncbi:hypothetical protein LEMLEM_LOCUS14309 [Lemmus lemmus]
MPDKCSNTEPSPLNSTSSELAVFLISLSGSSGSRPGRMPRQAEETTKSRRMHRPYRLTDAGATSAGWTKKRRKQRNVSYESGKELMPSCIIHTLSQEQGMWLAPYPEGRFQNRLP